MKLLGCLFVAVLLFAYIQAQNGPAQDASDQNGDYEDPDLDSVPEDKKPDSFNNIGPPRYFVSCDSSQRNFSSSFNSTSCWNCKGNRLCFKEYHNKLNGNKCVMCGGQRRCFLKDQQVSVGCFLCNSKQICYGSYNS